ncbi:MAG: hypothetical protein KAU21_11465 [Gammaproteobacteria bacterium]|nr:hypothetical protein [Gammaproteobacteria bacterium]
MKFLNTKPTDLTMIAKNNGGQYPNLKAGTYPFLRVYQVIEAGLMSGFMVIGRCRSGVIVISPTSQVVSPFGGQYEKVVRGRILELVYYIQTLQQP